MPARTLNPAAAAAAATTTTTTTTTKYYDFASLIYLFQ